MTTEFVKVPGYREDDGSKTFFLPDCRWKNTGYEIGERKKDKERGIMNYWDALAKVLLMSTPRFRRRNKSGNSGTIACKAGDVEEIRRDFIESERVKYGG